jgi:hypothetical protein
MKLSEAQQRAILSADVCDHTIRCGIRTARVLERLGLVSRRDFERKSRMWGGGVRIETVLIFELTDAGLAERDRILASDPDMRQLLFDVARLPKCSAVNFPLRSCEHDARRLALVGTELVLLRRLTPEGERILRLIQNMEAGGE